MARRGRSPTFGYFRTAPVHRVSLVIRRARRPDVRPGHRDGPDAAPRRGGDLTNVLAARLRGQPLDCGRIRESAVIIRRGVDAGVYDGTRTVELPRQDHAPRLERQ